MTATFGAPLSEREQQVINHLMRGENSIKTGIALGISETTVRTHIVRVCKKLGVHGQLALVIKLTKGE